MDGSRKAKTPDEIHIKRAMNGGYIVRHSYDNSSSGPAYQPPTEHAFANHKSMMTHVHAATGGGKAAPETTREAPSHEAGEKAARRTGAGVD